MKSKNKIYVPIPKMAGGAEIYFKNTKQQNKEFNFEVDFFPSLFGFWPYKKKPKIKNKPRIVHSILEGGGKFKRKNNFLILSELHIVKDSTFYEKHIKTNLMKRIYYFIYKLYRKNSIKKANKIIAISNYTKKELIKQFGTKVSDKIDVIYPQINLKIFKKKQNKTFFNKKYKNKIKLFYSGNLSLRKGSDLLPKIMKELGEDYVLFYTEGLNKQIPENIKKDLDKEKNIVGLKKLTLKDLIKAYNCCDIFLFPSRLEGFGYSIAEAMACKKPIIATNVASIPELVINGKGGFLCEMDDMSCFVEKIRFLSKNKKLIKNFGEYNRKRISKIQKENKNKYKDLIWGLK